MSNYEMPEKISQEILKEISNDPEMHPLTLDLLIQRGFKNSEEIKKFLSPSYVDDIGNPFDIHGMDISVTRIIDAMKKGETIAIYSDYDCDGIPGGVLLRTFFNDIGYEKIEVYVPHRHNEGYGLHNHAIDALKERNVKLIITVDLAITNIDEINYAKKIGIDVIITDHHLPIQKEEGGEVMPEAFAVINSKQKSCTYHDDMLCGCAVAWKLVCALLITMKQDVLNKNKIVKSEKAYANVLEKVSSLKEGYEKWLLDLVAISTVADMVPLIKENRALAYFGLKVLRQTKRHGLNHIFRMQGVSKTDITEDDIAFTVAPRINAAGRMGDPILAHHMLYERDDTIAQGFVENIEALNMERKQGVKDITAGINFDALTHRNDDNGMKIDANEIIVVGDMSWGPGILGLIAQKIIDETGKPTFVWGQGDDKESIKGSCRSKGDVHVVELMTKCIEMFPGIITHAGGHEQAGGFACSLDTINELSKALNASAKHVTKRELGKEKTLISGELLLQDVSLKTFNAINALAPFGIGNPKPLFAFKDVLPLSVRWFGKKGEHLEIMYTKNSKEIKAIMFFAPKILEEKAKKTHMLLSHIERSVFRGKTEIRLRIVDILL